jgi:hypothetical protein
MQIQNAASLALPEPDNFGPASKPGDKVERPRSVKLHPARGLDMAWVSYIKDRQSRALILFDIKQRSAVNCIAQEHRLAFLPR